MGLLAALLLGSLVACGPSLRPTVHLPAGPVIVDVVEQGKSYVLQRDRIPAGRAVFRVRNASRLAHDLRLVALPEDLPSIQQQLRGAERRAVETLVRLPPHPPGASDTFAVDLAPGRYALLCFERDGTGEPHALDGMALEFRVHAPSRSASSSE